MAQFWHTLKKDKSKYRLTFMLDKKELSLTLDDFRTIFHLPQANADNHDSFVTPPSFLEMVPLFKQQLGFTMELKTSSSFKTTGLLQPWQTLCKIFSKCLTTRVIGWDQPPLQIMQMYHNLKDDDIMKNIFNSGRYKDKVGMKIPDWMILEEMKNTEHYRMYAEVFGLDVPLTQSQPTESTQGMHRTPSAPRRSTRLTPPAPVPTVDKADEMILQDTLQISLAEHKSREEQEAKNVELVKEHLASVEIEKMVEGSKNVIDDSLLNRNDEPKILDTRLEPRSDKESSEVEITKDKEVEITNDKEVEITNVVIPVNVNEEEEEITDEVYELKRREKGKIVEESRSTPFPTPIRSPRIHTDLVSSDTEKLQELTVTDTTPSSRSPSTNLSKTNRLLSLFKAKPARFKRYKNFFQELQGRYTYLFEHLKARFLSRKSFDTLADHLQEVMVESLPTMVDTHIKEQVKKQVPGQVPQTTCRSSAVRPRDQDDPHDNAHPEGENHAKQRKTYEYKAYIESYASDDDEILTKQMSQDIMEEVSLTIDELKLKKMVDKMLRQRCTSGDEHQYHIDQMKNFLKSDIRDPDAPPLSLINQDLLYLKKGSTRPEKIVLSLYKFPAIIFNDDDIEERTSIWVNKCVKKFNPYAQYGVEHWKNPHAKIFNIRKQKEPGNQRKANECIVSITEPDYKNLNKNDIEDMYLLIMNDKVPDYVETGLPWSLSVFIKSSVIWERVHDFQLGIKSYQQKVNLTAPTIFFPRVEKHKMFSIIYEPVHGIIYKNSKKEKRVMRHSKIHKFCDATLNRVLEGLRSYNNDVKYGYIQRDLTNEEVEYLKLFEEEIEVRLKYQNQTRRWEMYVNGRPLGPRRERPK
ncbi:hypothetical protein Tco_1359778 [Tanacetum coccineum]